jgi:hypothetical protein
MTWRALTVVVVFMFLVGPVRSSLARLLALRRMLSRGHFLELAGLLAKAKEAALANILEAAHSAASGEIPALGSVSEAQFTTSAGLCVLYTIRRDGSRYAHHLSFSLGGGWLPRSSATGLVVFVHGVLSFSDAPCDLHVSKGGIYHFVVEMDEERHASFASTAPHSPRSEEIPGIMKECWNSEGRKALLQALAKNEPLRSKL